MVVVPPVPGDFDLPKPKYVNKYCCERKDGGGKAGFEDAGEE